MNEPEPQAATVPISPPRIGLDAAATVFPYPPGVRRVADELTSRLATSTRIAGIPLVPAVDDSQRAWRHRELPRLAKELRLAGILSFTSAFPVLGPGRRVQVLHELPWRHGVAENAGRGHRLWARQGWRRADAIVVPSERVLCDLADDAPRAAARARVIPWGLSAGFGPTSDPDEAQRLEHLGLGAGDFFLAAGATRPKKRLDAYLVALAQFGSAAPRLVVTGEITEALTGDLRLARTLGLEGKLVFLGRVDEADMAMLTRRARVALSLADSEGFGFGTLEALASGTPVLVTPASAQAELAGQAGIQVSPDDPDGIAAALREVLRTTRDSPADEAQRAARVERAHNFTWERCVQRLEDLLVTL